MDLKKTVVMYIMKENHEFKERGNKEMRSDSERK